MRATYLPTKGKNLLKNRARSYFRCFTTVGTARRTKKATIYIRCVSAARRSAQDALRSAGLRHPIFGSRVYPGSLRRPITLFTIRTAIISRQQSEPAGFSLLCPRVYTRRCERKKERGRREGEPLFSDAKERDQHKRHAQHCRGAVLRSRPCGVRRGRTFVLAS